MLDNGENAVQVLGQAGPALSEEAVVAVVGAGAADRGGKGNINVGDGGVAFVLASAGNVPGGPATVCLPQMLWEQAQYVQPLQFLFILCPAVLEGYPLLHNMVVCNANAVDTACRR